MTTPDQPTWTPETLLPDRDLDELLDERWNEGHAAGVAEGLRRAATAVRAQAGLPDLVHFDRPSDFRKGVLTCLAALEALEPKPAEQDGDGR